MLLNKYESDVLGELAALYKKYGYKRYKLGCFEEYSLYQENKDFLIGKNVITFSDLSGRLMAMRPDVTLSVIKHNDVAEGGLEKFYYNEKVYRQSTAGQDYKEISQTGVEVVGKLDGASIAEVTMLICETLALIGGDYMLDVSHMGFTEGLLSEFTSGREEVLGCIKRKDLHDFYKLAGKYGYPDRLVKATAAIVKANGSAENTIEQAKAYILNDGMKSALAELESLYKIMKDFGYGDRINVNFSVANDADYYNGVVYNGYIKGIPHCVLSGGRYDKLLKKLEKRGGAIGFALYLGEIERYLKQSADGVDYLILYNSATEVKALLRANELIKGGNSVRLSNCVPDGLAYRELVDLTFGESGL